MTAILALLCVAAIGCSSSLIQCKIEAVEKLPEDPLAVNSHDVSNLIARLENCRAAPSDAGPR